jgi:ABC-type proline/glycine betaine transport system permease subunit
MGVAPQLLRITLFSFFSFLAANGVGLWDTEAETLTLHVDSVVALVVGVGGHLATLGWWRRASQGRS